MLVLLGRYSSIYLISIKEYHFFIRLISVMMLVDSIFNILKNILKNMLRGKEQIKYTFIKLLLLFYTFKYIVN